MYFEISLFILYSTTYDLGISYYGGRGHDTMIENNQIHINIHSI